MARSTRFFIVYSLYSESESFETRTLKGSDSETLLSGLKMLYSQVEPKHMDNHVKKVLEVRDGGHMSENLTFL